MTNSKFRNLLRQLKNPDTSALYHGFVKTLIEHDFDDKQAKNQQWVEAWLETSPASCISKTDQGVYVAISIREKVLAKLVNVLERTIKDSKNVKANFQKTTMDKILEMELDNWAAHDIDWLMTLLTTIHCNEYGINNDEIDENQNGRFSIYASSYNERVNMANTALKFINTSSLITHELEELIEFCGPFFVLAFCEDEILKQRTLNYCGVL